MGLTDKQIAEKMDIDYKRDLPHLKPPVEKKHERANLSINNGIIDSSIFETIKLYQKLNKFELSDMGNAEAIVALFGDKLRYDHTSKRWLIFNGNTWIIDQKARVITIALDAIRTRIKAAADIDDEIEKLRLIKWAIRSEKTSNIEAALKAARSFQPIAAIREEFDTDPFLLGCKNGVVNLRDATVIRNEPGLMVSQSTGIVFDPEAECPRWERFIDEIFDSNQSIINYVQTAAGYSLTGSAKEQIMFLLYGEGGNGKTTLLDIFAKIFGDYACVISPSTLAAFGSTTSKGDAEIAALRYGRFVTASETQKKVQLDESTIKQLTGGDTINGKFLYQNPICLTVNAKIWFAVNHLPRVDDNSYGFWRRIRVIEFLQRFEGDNRDNGLDEELSTELSGILNWMIAGSIAWQKFGFPECPEVDGATRQYRQSADTDIVRLYLQNNTMQGSEYSVSAKSLYEDFENWAESIGEKHVTPNLFGRRLTKLGFSKERISIGEERPVVYLGLKLKNGSPDMI